MPSAVFPRNPKWHPVDVTDLDSPWPLMARTSSGIIRARATTERGFGWSEEYPLLNVRDPDVRNFLAWIRWAGRTGVTFDVQHPTSPGSGLPPNGTLEDETISGANQSGESINVSGGTFFAGDIIAIQHYSNRFEIVETDTGVIHINPPIFEGNEPNDGAIVWSTDVMFRVKMFTKHVVPSIQNTFYYGGLKVSFVEVVNEGSLI